MSSRALVAGDVSAGGASGVASSFHAAYREAVKDVLRLVTPEGLDVLSRHNPGWSSKSFDVGGYLRASETRYRAALDIYFRCGGDLELRRLRVLDVGGFLGAFPLALVRLGASVTIAERYDYYCGGFDALRAMLKSEGVEIWDADLTEEGVRRVGGFDLVTNMAMLEHLANSPRPLMENMRASLAEGGKLVAEVPNIAYWPKRIAALKGRSTHPPLAHVYAAANPFTGHHREYTAADLRELLGLSGHRLLELETLTYTPLRQGLLGRLADWPRFHLRSGRELLLACAERDDATGPASVRLPQENVYGHVKRLHWIRGHLKPGARAVEFGCGTGCMLTLPLRLWGHDVRGVDLDVESIEYGRRLLAKAGLDPSALAAADVRGVPEPVDVIIASEVLEHLEDGQLEETLAMLRERLEPGGLLLVTVPNGFGWFELEALLWYRTGFHRLAERQLAGLISCFRELVLGGYLDSPYQSTLADSPHRQRFTLTSIRALLQGSGFEVLESRGSVLFCGPFSHTALTGVRPFMELNAALGDRMPRLAAGFYLAARRP